MTGVTKKRILLLTAPRPESGYSPVHYGDNRPPQGLGYLAAYMMKQGHIADIIDLYAFGGKDFSRNRHVNQEEIGEQLDIDVEAYISDFAPDFIGMYIHSMSFGTACDLSERLKKKFPHIPQLCGGPHPTIAPQSIPDTFDFVVIGEGEKALLDIAEGRISQRIVSGSRLNSRDLEELPWPNYDFFWDKPYNYALKLFNKDIEPVLTISTSRGCPFRCRFCGVKYIYPHYITVSAEKVFGRMRELAHRYGVKAFYFREDCFTANLKRLETFCDLIIESGEKYSWACESRVRELSPRVIEKMAKAGCIGLYIGCESGSPAVLKDMRKDETRDDYIEKFPLLHEYGIGTYTTWVYGTPRETPADRKMTKELIEIINPTAVDEFIYIGIPVSDYYNELYEAGDYEFVDRYGFLYPRGYLSLSSALYGKDDPRVIYVQRVYRDNKVKSIHIEW